jgi:hypothetical protein
VHGAPQPDTKYVAFVDAASGTGKDSYALAIAHVEPDGSVVIDVVRERKPRFVPSQVIAEYAELLAAYHVTEIRGDSSLWGRTRSRSASLPASPVRGETSPGWPRSFSP